MGANTTKSKISIKHMVRFSYPQNWLAAAAFFSAGYWTTGIHFNFFWFMGVIYFLSPYNLLMLAANGSLPTRTYGKRPDFFWRFVLIANVPFWIYFWFTEDWKTNLAMVSALAVLVIFGTLKRRKNGLPGADVIFAGLFSIAPFLWGITRAGTTGIWWVPAVVTAYLIAVAGWALYLLVLIGPDRAGDYRTLATRYGAETTLILCLGLCVVAAVLPTVYYGFYGLPVSVLLSGFVVKIIQLLPFRAHDIHASFGRAQQAVVSIAYLWGILIALYFTILYILR